MTLPIRGESLGNPDAAASIAIERGGENPDAIRRYARQLWRRCAELSIRADVAFAQADLETGDRESGVGFRSDRWVEEGNPAGMGVWTGKPDAEAGETYLPEEWADIHATHLAGYAGIMPGVDLIALDFRWEAMIRAGYFGVAATVDDLDERWAEDPGNYGDKIAARWSVYLFPAQTRWTPPGDGTGGATNGGTAMGFDIGDRPIRIAVGTGHANTSGGNAYERGINARAVNAFLKLARASDGFDVRTWTPSEGLGTFPGPLDTAAATVRTWVAQGWRPDVCFELHQEGLGNTAVRGGHIIYPDARGLSGREACAPNYVDIDVREAAGRMAEIMVAEYGVPTRYMPSRGMSERETGVGGDGWRLGFFGALSDCYFAENACVFISEGATYTNRADRAIMDRADYPEKNALGVLKAIVYLATARGNWTYAYRIGAGEDADDPIDDPTEPQPSYAAPIAIPALDQYDDTAITQIPGEVRFAWEGNQYMAVFVGDRVRNPAPTPRYQRLDATGDARVGADVPAGSEFDVRFHLTNLTDHKAPTTYRTPWRTIIRVADTARVADRLSTQAA